jgi:hypothetical protein
MARTPWLSLSHIQLHNHINYTVTYVKSNAIRFGMGKDTPLGIWFVDVFLKEYDLYNGSFDIWYDPATQTPGANARLKMAEEKIIPLYRELCAFLKANPLVDNADLIEMNIPKKNSHQRTKTPVADKAPSFHIVQIEGNRLRLFYYPRESEHNAKPEGQHGAEIVWDFTTGINVDPEKLTNSTFDTASPCTIQFKADDIGKLVSFSMRWENNRGIKGPWSMVQSITVP